MKIQEKSFLDHIWPHSPPEGVREWFILIRVYVKKMFRLGSIYKFMFFGLEVFGLP